MADLTPEAPRPLPVPGLPLPVALLVLALMGGGVAVWWFLERLEGQG